MSNEKTALSDALSCHEGRVVRIDASEGKVCLVLIVRGLEKRRLWLTSKEFIGLCGYQEDIAALEQGLPIISQLVRPKHGLLPRALSAPEKRGNWRRNAAFGSLLSKEGKFRLMCFWLCDLARFYSKQGQPIAKEAALQLLSLRFECSAHAAKHCLAWCLRSDAFKLHDGQLQAPAAGSYLLGAQGPSGIS